MRERRCEGATAAARCFNLHLSASRPLLVLLGGVRVRPPNGDLRRHSPPTESVTCSGALAAGRTPGGLPPPSRRAAVRQKKSTLGRDSGKGRGREGRAHLPCPSGGVRARPRPRPVKDAVDRSPALRPSVRRPDGRPNERPSRGPSPDGCPSKRTLFQLADGTVAVKMTTAA